MSQKPEYYSVLGVEKSASEAEIKSAYTKAAMRNHPDRMINKSDAEKEAAKVKFQEIEEAYQVLSNASKRQTYDSYGHDGLARLAAGQSGGTGRSFADLADPGIKRAPVTEEDAFNYFDRAGSNTASRTPVGINTDGVPVDREAAAAHRRAQRDARRNGTIPQPASVTDTIPKGTGAEPIGQPAAPVKKPAQPSKGFDFKDAAGDLRGAQDKIGQLYRGTMIEVPLDTLERFRDNLQDVINTVDAAIVRAKSGGPKPR